MNKKYRPKDTWDAIQYDGTRKSLKLIAEFLPEGRKRDIHVLEYPGDGTFTAYVDSTVTGREMLELGDYVTKKSGIINVYTEDEFEEMFEVKE